MANPEYVVIREAVCEKCGPKTHLVLPLPQWVVRRRRGGPGAVRAPLPVTIEYAKVKDARPRCGDCNQRMRLELDGVTVQEGEI